ncbi:hypothetical protein AVEN_54276-1 [Araneus ventricosus]|uniref:Uncharacterized protein n=1 Tax=Araneus ventricosus TaxID=182803 RepID=A0A4Y2Q5Q3_ARAVE|nr:hypothetical protein AVEN_176323-1 [Araneus ventricosus]GBN57917.1 hypothetical protein AVEN_54276-1 [Araneus ventricosus]
MVKRNFICVQKNQFYYCNNVRWEEFYPVQVLAFHFSPALRNEMGERNESSLTRKKFRAGVKRLYREQKYLQQEKIPKRGSRCFDMCPRKGDRKTSVSCSEGHKLICERHVIIFSEHCSDDKLRE